MSNVASKEQISKTIYEEKTLENKGKKPSFSYGDFVSEYGSLYTVQNAIRFVESTNQIDELKISRGVLNFFSSLLHRYNFNASLLSECQEELHPRMVQIRIAGRYTATQKSTSVDRYKRMCQESGLLETKWVANGSYKVIALSKKFFLCFSLAVIQQERAALLDSAMGFLTRDFDLEKKKELDVKESEAKKLIKQLRPQAKDGNNHTGAVAGLSSAIKKHAQKIEYIKSQYPSDYKDNPDYCYSVSQKAKLEKALNEKKLSYGKTPTICTQKILKGDRDSLSFIAGV